VDLYEYTLLSSFDITKRKHHEVKVYLRDNVLYPVFERDEHGYILCFAKPKRMQSGKLSYLGWLFDSHNEVHITMLWRLFKASIHHLNSHIVTSDFEAYANWSKDKDLDLATFAVCIVEDAVVRAYLKSFFPSHILDNAFANAISYLALKPFHAISNDTLRVMAAILSNFSTGLSKGKLNEKTENEINESVLALKRIESTVHKGLLDKAKIQNEENLQNFKDLIFDERVKTADFIYKILEKYGETSEVPSLPYTESHGRNLIFHRNSIPAEEEIEPVLKKTLEVFDLQTVQQEDIHNELHGKSIQAEVSQVFSSWEAKEVSQMKIVEEYKALGKGTHFKSFGFPQEDYTEYVRRQNVLGSTVRRILEKLRLFKNIGGEDYRHEMGLLDLQEAIQVIASKSPRTDVFVRDELQTQDEQWAILIDASHSLSFFTGEVQGIALCMAEVARKLMVNSNSWSMYAFNTGFYIIKDFSEPYSNHTRARIGGLKHTGMTYLPDGLTLAAEALRRKMAELKILVAVSDFFPSGYGEIEKALAESARKIEKSGIGVIGIGINSNAVKKYFRTHCVVENPYDLMKKFVKAFYEYSSTT
jgi:hypothetical protein